MLSSFVLIVFVGALYFTKIQKYGNTDPLSIFYPALERTIGVIRVN